MSIAKLFFHKISQVLSSRNIYLTKSLNYRGKPQVLQPNFDYIRYATLGLCYEEIMEKKIGGSVAELGVFRGDFSVRLNKLFSDRNLYLFDTFEGFSQQDVHLEREMGHSSGNQDFSSTNIDLVRSKMPYPQKCIFKKGHFPDTAIDLEEEFCFVSIDADLYAPIYNGLAYFYPRLKAGGYIFIHDFNNLAYPGAKQAVIRYCLENNLSYIPLADSGGTAIIAK